MVEAFSVIYEDNHLIVVNKAAGILVQGDATGDTPLSDLVKEYIRVRYKKPGAVFLGVVHRIDRPVSGLVVFARTSKALERMNALFRQKKTIKTYWAQTRKRPATDSGSLVHWLAKDTGRNKAIIYNRETPGALRSELNYEVTGESGGFWMIRVNPVTGRPHQIRAQLSSIGCSIRGDVKYGYETPNPDGSICLHARQLEFIHPVKKELLILKAPLPQSNVWQPFRNIES